MDFCPLGWNGTILFVGRVIVFGAVTWTVAEVDGPASGAPPVTFLGISKQLSYINFQ